MFAIEVQRTEDGVTLTPRGELDGSAAWRVVRLARRFARTRHVAIDLASVARLYPFGASVLGQGLAVKEVSFHDGRPEQIPLLRAAGLEVYGEADPARIEREAAEAAEQAWDLAVGGWEAGESAPI